MSTASPPPCTPTGPAWATPVRAAGPGPSRAGRYASGAAPATTNQRMEIQAALEAVTALDGPLEIVSDSTYVVNCFRDRWWEGWLARGWRNSQKKPVANRDLWEPLIAAYRADPGRAPVPVGQGPQRRPHERPGRPPGRRRRRPPSRAATGRVIPPTGPRRPRPTVPRAPRGDRAGSGSTPAGPSPTSSPTPARWSSWLPMPADPARPVAAGVARVGGAEVLAHGTTVATNALLERRGGRVALISTEGQRDVIEIARQARPSLYDLWADRPEPLVPRRAPLRGGRPAGCHGQGGRPLSGRCSRGARPTSTPWPSACLHADRNPEHERAVAAARAARARTVVCSSDVSPEFREYERTVTTVADAYLRRPCAGLPERLCGRWPPRCW